MARGSYYSRKRPLRRSSRCEHGGVFRLFDSRGLQFFAPPPGRGLVLGFQVLGVVVSERDVLEIMEVSAAGVEDALRGIF